MLMTSLYLCEWVTALFVGNHLDMDTHRGGDGDIFMRVESEPDHSNRHVGLFCHGEGTDSLSVPQSLYLLQIYVVFQFFPWSLLGYSLYVN